MNISLLTMSKVYFTQKHGNVENSTAMSNIEKNQYNNQYDNDSNIINPHNNTKSIHNNKNFDTVELSNVSQRFAYC